MLGPAPLSGGDGNARGKLQQLRTVADLHARDFASEGFRALFAVLQRELDDEYFALIRQHLRQLKFTRGTNQRTPRRRQQGHRLRSAPAEPAEGQLVPAHVCLRSAWLYLLPASAGRRRRTDIIGVARPRDQPGGERAGAVGGAYRCLLQHAADRTVLLHRVPQPLCCAGTARCAILLSHSCPCRRPTAQGIRAL